MLLSSNLPMELECRGLKSPDFDEYRMDCALSSTSK